MKITLYGIPSSVAEWVRRLLAGSLGDVVWKLFVLALLTAVAVALVAGGGAVGAAFGGILLGTLLSDDVRALVTNLWHRNWAEVEAPW